MLVVFEHKDKSNFDGYHLKIDGYRYGLRINGKWTSKEDTFEKHPVHAGPEDEIRINIDSKIVNYASKEKMDSLENELEQLKKDTNWSSVEQFREKAAKYDKLMEHLKSIGAGCDSYLYEEDDDY